MASVRPAFWKMISRIAVLFIAGILAGADPVGAHDREVLQFDLTSADRVVEADTGDGCLVRAENNSDGGWGWEIGVYRKKSEDNLLYPKGNWHGAFPCQIVPSPAHGPKSNFCVAFNLLAGRRDPSDPHGLR
jgi:hypothetical protein